jgi:hypothetical protein
VRVGRWACVALAASTVACAGGAASRPRGSPGAGVASTGTGTAGGAGTVSGTVIDDQSNLPVDGRSIVIGPLRTMTDEAGHFSLASVPAVYDLVIVEPDGTAISLYEGLHRRDVLVRHHQAGNSQGSQARKAGVRGTLLGGPSWPLKGKDLVSVSIFSELARGNKLFGGNIPFNDGPAFGPVAVIWNGPPTLPAQVCAYSWFHTADDAGSIDASDPSTRVFAYGAQALTLHEGESSLTVPLQIVTRTARVTGTIVHDPATPATQRQVWYALPPWRGARLPVGGDMAGPRSESFDFVVPDPEIPDASLCFMAFSSTGDRRRPLVWDQICGITSGHPVTAVLQEPPRLTSPAEGSTVHPTTTMAWTAFEGGVYRVDLKSGQLPSASAPNISVYTAARSMIWPDLAAADVTFPAIADYGFVIVGLGVFASIDDLAGPSGFASAAPREYRQSYMEPVKVQVSR